MEHYFEERVELLTYVAVLLSDFDLFLRLGGICGLKYNLLAALIAEINSGLDA